MRTPAVAFAALLMLLLLATRAYGIRLDRQWHEAINSKKMADPKAGDAAKASIAGDSVKKHCTPDGCCSGKVKKALLAHAGAAAEAKQQSNSTGNDHRRAAVDGDGEAASQQGRGHDAAEATTSSAASSSPAPPERQQTYPDMMDIAGMDYSPATRKPPIHN